MTEIRIIYSELLENIISRLAYYSGKRAGNKEEYHRYAPCSADKDLLRELTVEAAAVLSMGLGHRSGGYEISSDNIKFRFDIGDTDISAPEELVREVMSTNVILGWLQLTGAPDISYWQKLAIEKMELLRDLTHFGDSLISRRLPPL